MRTLASLDSPIRSLVVSPDGATVVIASGDDISFLDVVSGQRRVTALSDGARRVAWGPDGPLAGTASGEVWTVGKKVELLVEAIDEEISGLAVAGDGTIAVCGGDPFAVATFGRYGNEEWRGEPAKWPYCVRFSADGRQLAVATWDGRLVVLDTRDLPDDLADSDAEYAGGPIFDVQFLPDHHVLVAGARFVRLWDPAGERYLRAHELPTEALAIAVAPDAALAVVSTNDQRLRLFGLPALDELGQLPAGNGATDLRSPFPDYAEHCRINGAGTVRTLTFHPDGSRLFASTEDGRLLAIERAELEAVIQAARTPSQPPTAQRDAVAPSSNGRDRLPTNRPSAIRPSAITPPAITPPANKPSRTRPSASKLSTNKPSRTGPSANKLSTNKPSAGRLSADKRSANQPAKRRTAGKLASAKQSASKLSPAKLAGKRSSRGAPVRGLAGQKPRATRSARKLPTRKAARTTASRRTVKKPPVRSQPRRRSA